MENIFVSIFIFACTLVATYGIFPTSFNTAGWMSEISQYKNITEISIPGSHDSMALFGGPFSIRQQDSLETQLNNGIRALDIRCRHFDEQFSIHSGLHFQQASFDQVLDTTVSFVKRNPSETIFLRVKEEYQPSGSSGYFSATFRTYVTDEKYKLYLKYITSCEPIPLVREVRGKIVILQDFDDIDEASPNCRWAKWSNLVVQENNIVPSACERTSKWTHLQTQLDKSVKEHPKTKLYINIASGSSAQCYPNIVADFVLPKLENYLSKLEDGSTVGILYMDFPKSTHIKRIIKLNGINVGQI